MLGFIIGYLDTRIHFGNFDQNDNGFKNSAVSFTKKSSLTLKIKFKIRRAIIYEASNLIDNEADYCYSQRHN